jgi:multidrug efflux pump subunit AcrA (membrane-fusion protein)
MVIRPRHSRGLILLAALATLLACSKPADDKPVERLTVVTTAAAVRKDLPVTESVVGSTTALGVAEQLDPNAARRGTFTIRLPFPVRVARQLRVGQPVTLSSFDRPERRAAAHIREIRPALDSTTQTMEVIAELPGGREWYSLGSVRGEVVLGLHRGAIVVPEQAVVLRPGREPGSATTVVYVVDGETATERRVDIGLQREGEIEILTGLAPGEAVAVDGASQLTEGARVRRREAAATTATGGTTP